MWVRTVGDARPPKPVRGHISTNMDWILNKTETDIRQVQEMDLDTTNMGRCPQMVQFWTKRCFSCDVGDAPPPKPVWGHISTNSDWILS